MGRDHAHLVRLQLSNEMDLGSSSTDSVNDVGLGPHLLGVVLTENPHPGRNRCFKHIIPLVLGHSDDVDVPVRDS